MRYKGKRKPSYYSKIDFANNVINIRSDKEGFPIVYSIQIPDGSYIDEYQKKIDTIIKDLHEGRLKESEL